LLRFADLNQELHTLSSLYLDPAGQFLRAPLGRHSTVNECAHRGDGPIHLRNFRQRVFSYESAFKFSFDTIPVCITP